MSKIWEEALLKLVKKIATNVLESPERALEITSNIATAAESRNRKYVLSTSPEMMSFYYTGKGLHVGKFVRFYFI